MVMKVPLLRTMVVVVLRFLFLFNGFLCHQQVVVAVGTIQSSLSLYPYNNKNDVEIVLLDDNNSQEDLLLHATVMAK